VERRFFLDELPRDVVVIVDASPWGTGGILVHASSWSILAAFTYTATESDAMELGIKLGEHTAQAVLEFLGVYVALAHYMRFFKNRRRVPVVRGDSAAALGAAQRLSSPSPPMNYIGAELSLLLEREDCADVEGSHIPGKLNVCADFLSRMMMPGGAPSRPSALGESKVKEVKKRRPFSLQGTGPGPRPELWGKEKGKGSKGEAEDISGAATGAFQ